MYRRLLINKVLGQKYQKPLKLQILFARSLRKIKITVGLIMTRIFI